MMKLTSPTTCTTRTRINTQTILMTFTGLNCVEPNVNYESVLREARKHAQANNVKLIDHVRLQAQVPFVESLALMKGY